MEMVGILSNTCVKVPPWLKQEVNAAQLYEVLVGAVGGVKGLCAHAFASDLIVMMNMKAEVALTGAVSNGWQRDGTCITGTATVLGADYYPEGEALKLMADNAGGSSMLSEALSFAVLQALVGAANVMNEMELMYSPYYSKKTDYSCTIFGQRWGVSVTRAMGWKEALTLGQAQTLARKKLEGIQASTANVVNDNWNRQILHVLCATSKEALVFRKAVHTIEQELKTGVVVFVTVLYRCPGAFWGKGR